MLHQGKLKDWNPIKGHGFIQQDKAGPDIRISSSGFRNKPEKLQDGDSIFFQIEVDPQGHPKAVLAYKAGQRFAPAPFVKKPSVSSVPFQRLLSVLVMVSIIAWLGYQSVYLVVNSTEPEVLVAESDAVVAEKPTLTQLRTDQGLQLQCTGKQHCSEMSSCDEAKFYLKNCPDVLIDGDNDGRPCEEDCGHGVF